MPSNPAQQTQQAQQANQLQAEQFLAQQQQKNLATFLGLPGSPAQAWAKGGGIAAPNFAYSPAAVGGGSISGNRDTLHGAIGPWRRTPAGGTPAMPPPRGWPSGAGRAARMRDRDEPPAGKPPTGGSGGGGGNYKGPPPRD